MGGKGWFSQIRFLGLKTLTVLQRTIEFIAKRGVEVDLGSIPLDDKGTFEMLSGGDTVGVFQLESSGMRDVLRGLKPDRFEDIIAVVALYRPGPMENIKDYVTRKHDPSQISYMHPELEPVLAETYGIMIYQEQVQQAARVLAGYTLGSADILRRAMGKKSRKKWMNKGKSLPLALLSVDCQKNLLPMCLIKFLRLLGMDLTNHTLPLMHLFPTKQLI